MQMCLRTIGSVLLAGKCSVREVPLTVHRECLQHAVARRPPRSADQFLIFRIFYRFLPSDISCLNEVVVTPNMRFAFRPVLLYRTMCLRMHHLDVHYKVANGTTHTHTHTHTHVGIVTKKTRDLASLTKKTRGSKREKACCTA